MKIIKILTRYIISDDAGISISVEVLGGSNKLNIFNGKSFHHHFEFVENSPELISRIAILLLEAIKLTESNK